MGSQNQEPPVTLPERLWEPTDDFKYTPPRPDGDIWANCLEPLLQEDKKQCAAWREEVQNLLIFAGLFSAVVTTFVVDSYQNLQPSPDQRTVDLLVQIASSLGNSSLSSYATSSSSPFSPSASSVRVNALWFLSLVISLTTVLVGIVALQWIREYESYKGHLTSREIFALRNMRHESMNKWFVPHIFTSLPLILQAALTLFFIGLMDFLLNLYPLAAFPTVAVISVTLLFLLLTTILPSLQYYATPPFNTSGIPTTPFPYKSPQSWIVHKMIQVILRPLQSHKKPEFLDWNGFDWEWVCERTYQALKNKARNPRLGDFKYGRVPDDGYPYDTAHGVAHVLSNYSHSNDVLARSAYHSFLEHNNSESPVCRWNLESQSRFFGPQLALVAPVLNGGIVPERSTRDRSLLLFLRMFWSTKADPLFYRHQWELLIRTSSTLTNDKTLLTTCRDVLRFTILSEASKLGEIFHEDLMSQLVLLYQQSVKTAVKAGDGGSSSSQNVLVSTADDKDPDGAHSGDVYFARIMGILDGSSNASFVQFRELIEPLHAALAEKILHSRTAAFSSELAFAHRLGCTFVHSILFNQPKSLPEWSDTYKESLAFLITALFKTVGDPWHHSNYYNHGYWISLSKDFLSQISSDIRDRIDLRCDNFALEQTEAPSNPDSPSLPASRPSPQSSPTSGSALAVNPGLRSNPPSPSRLVSQSHGQGHTVQVFLSDDP